MCRLVLGCVLFIFGFALCAGQSANSDGDLRLVTNSGLVGGSSGRLEVYYNSQWGTVCDDLFGETDALVACRQLGYSTYSRYDDVGELNFLQASFSTPTWLDDVSCTGVESRLIDCNHVGFFSENCAHSEDIGLICSGSSSPNTASPVSPSPVSPSPDGNGAVQDDVRLNGTNLLTGGVAGRVEIYYNGLWGTVCEDSNAKNAADVVCRQLGFTEAVYYGTVDELSYPEAPSSVHTILDNVNCFGGESRLGECSHSGYLSASCSHSDDLAVICTGTTSSSSAQSLLPTGSLRLNTQGDSHPQSFSGRLEVYINGVWGTVCDDGFRQTEADTACRQLGFLSALYYGTVGYIGFDEASGSTPIWLDDLGCSSDLSGSLIHCANSGFGTHNCGHGEDVALVCLGVGSLRLTSSSGSTSLSQSSGRLEVYVNGQWGTVCDDAFGQTDADVACRQLGFEDADSYDNVGFGSSTSRPILLDDLGCSSLDDFLLLCDHRGVGSHNCGHSEDVTLTCSTGSTAAIVIGVTVPLVLITIIVVVCVCICCYQKNKTKPQARSVPRVVNTVQPSTAATTNQPGTAYPLQPVSQQPYPVQVGYVYPTAYPTQPGAPYPTGQRHSQYAYPTGPQQPPTAYPTGQQPPTAYPTGQQPPAPYLSGQTGPSPSTQQEKPELYTDAPPPYPGTAVELAAYPPVQTDPNGAYPPATAPGQPPQQGPNYY